jgi:YfiH family protein
VAPLVVPVELGPDVGAAFTGRDASAPAPAIGAAGNLSHRRPHRPDDLAAARRDVADATGTDASTWHLLHQVHGADVAVVDERTPVGAELRGVDAAVTALPDRPLVVQAADCVPVLFAGDGVVAVAHAGRAGVVAGVASATVSAMSALGATTSTIRAVLGPAIGGCCYEVPASLQRDVALVVPGAAATTTWGTPSLDLPRAVSDQLEASGVGEVRTVGGCTACDSDARWFSHRRDPGSGRHAGLVVRRAGGGAPRAGEVAA